MSFFSPAVIILIGSLLVALGGIWAAHKQNQFESQLKTKQETLEAKNEEIIQLNQKMGVLSYHTMNMVTGGDSYAIAMFANNGGELLSQIHLSHHGKFPLYDLKIQIYDLDAKKNIAVLPVGNIGSIQHIQHWPLGHNLNFDLSGKTSQRFNILFYARNGMWIQQLIYKRLNDHWTSAMRIIRPTANFDKDEKSIIYKEISSDFPIVESEIEWE